MGKCDLTHGKRKSSLFGSKSWSIVLLWPHLGTYELMEEKGITNPLWNISLNFFRLIWLSNMTELSYWFSTYGRCVPKITWEEIKLWTFTSMNVNNIHKQTFVYSHVWWKLHPLHIILQWQVCIADNLSMNRVNQKEDESQKMLACDGYLKR